MGAYALHAEIGKPFKEEICYMSDTISRRMKIGLEHATGMSNVM